VAVTRWIGFTANTRSNGAGACWNASNTAYENDAF
jgi:hypothetical protein